MESNVRIVKSFKKLKPIPEIPEIPDFITGFLPSPSNSLLASFPNDQHVSSPTTPLMLGSPFNDLGSLGGSSSQPRLIQHPQSDAQKLSSKFERMESFLKDSGFDSVGEILKILFYNPSRLSGESDPRGSCHAKAVSRFLQGRNKIKMSDIISLIYQHKHKCAFTSFTTLFRASCPILTFGLSRGNPSCSSFIVFLGNKSYCQSCSPRNISAYFQG